VDAAPHDSSSATPGSAKPLGRELLQEVSLFWRSFRGSWELRPCHPTIQPGDACVSLYGIKCRSPDSQSVAPRLEAHRPLAGICIYRRHREKAVCYPKANALVIEVQSLIALLFAALICAPQT
jgi:hypothetical protein